MAGKNDPMKELNIVGPGTSIEGKIISVGSIRIDGKINGEITASESLTLGTSGEIEGSVEAKNIIIGGKVRGGIQAADRIVFESKAIVKGDIRAKRLVIDEGAMFDGHVVMTDKHQVNPYNPKSPLHGQQNI